MARGGVEGYINLNIYVSTFTAKLSQNVAASIVNRARSKVASPSNPNKGYAVGKLMNSIHVVGLDRYTYIAVAERPYAAMQEWGKPSTPFWNNRSYSYRPYMTPAAKETTDEAVFMKIVNEAWEGATMSSQRTR